MGVGCGGGGEVAGSFLRFPLPSSPSTESRHSPKDPAGPDACLCQQEEALQGLSQSHPAPPPANNPESVLCYPHSYTKGSVWKVGPRPKHETDRHSRGRKEVGRSRWGDRQGTSSQSQQTGEKRAGKEG